MVPPLGSRVSIRYRECGGGHTDVIGRLTATEPQVEVSTPTGPVRIDPADIVAVRELSGVPVRTAQIRALEHAAALAWPGTEQRWHRGWLMRAAGGHTSRANSAVPLDFSAVIADLPAVVDFYAARGLPPLIALPERLLPVRAEGTQQTRVMVRDITPGDPEPSAAELLDRPDDSWLACYRRDVPVEVLTAVVDGEVVFASSAGAAVGRGAVTRAPDGTAWLGISAVAVAADRRRRGHGRAVCSALLDWGARRGAHRAYVQVLAENDAAVALYTSLGFDLHHRTRYLDARSLIGLALPS